jgi:hypothetical protein
MKITLLGMMAILGLVVAVFRIPYGKAGVGQCCCKEELTSADRA